MLTLINTARKAVEMKMVMPVLEASMVILAKMMMVLKKYNVYVHVRMLVASVKKINLHQKIKYSWLQRDRIEKHRGDQVRVAFFFIIIWESLFSRERKKKMVSHGEKLCVASAHVLPRSGATKIN